MGTPCTKPGSCLFPGAICKPDTSSWLIFRARERNVTKMGARKNERPELKGQELPSSSQLQGAVGHCPPHAHSTPNPILPLPWGQAPHGKPRHPRWHRLGPPSVHPSVRLSSAQAPFPSCFYLCFYSSLPKGKLPSRPSPRGAPTSTGSPFPPASPTLWLNSEHEKPGPAGCPVPSPFSQEQRGHGATGVPPAPLPPAMGAVIWGAGGLEMAPAGEECGMGTSERGGGHTHNHPFPPPPKPEILRPEGVTTKFHSTDRKEIKSF